MIPSPEVGVLDWFRTGASSSAEGSRRGRHTEDRKERRGDEIMPSSCLSMHARLRRGRNLAAIDGWQLKKIG